MGTGQLLGESLLFGLTVGLMTIGLAGVFLPVVPGLPLVWLAALLYALVDGFRQLDAFTFAFLTLLALLGTGADLAASHLGARAGGASGWAQAAALAAGIAGLLFLNLVGALAGALLAIFAVEWLRQRSLRAALRSSAGWLAGWAAGRGAQFAIGALMVLVFVVRVLVFR